MGVFARHARGMEKRSKGDGTEKRDGGGRGVGGREGGSDRAGTK